MDFDFPEPSPAAYEEVRHRVLGEIRRQRRIRNVVRMIAAMAACVALVVSGWLAVRVPAPLPAPHMLARFKDAPPPLVVAGAPVVRRRKLHRRREAQPAQPLVVRLQTDDPNVVILWTVD
jgi:hypothetical protein